MVVSPIYLHNTQFKSHNCVSCAGVISATFQASLCQFNLGGKCPWLSPKLWRSGGNNSCLKRLGHCGSSCLYRSPSVNQERLSSKRLNRMVLHQFLIMVYTCYQRSHPSKISWLVSFGRVLNLIWDDHDPSWWTYFFLGSSCLHRKTCNDLTWHNDVPAHPAKFAAPNVATAGSSQPLT